MPRDVGAVLLLRCNPLGRSVDSHWRLGLAGVKDHLIDHACRPGMLGDVGIHLLRKRAELGDEFGVQPGAVVAGEDHQCVFGQAELFQRRNDLADAPADLPDDIPIQPAGLVSRNVSVPALEADASKRLQGGGVSGHGARVGCSGFRSVSPACFTLPIVNARPFQALPRRSRGIRPCSWVYSR